MTARLRDTALAALVSCLAACAAAPSPGAPTPTGPTPPAATPTTALRGVPGFDTRVYPGDSVLKAWRSASPYRWVGYYLPAPCHTDSTWLGRRAALAAMGWGTAIVFTGEQDWGAAARVTGPAARAAASAGTSPAPPPSAVAVSPPTAAATSGAAAHCTSANLTAEHGAADAALADSLAAAEGFPAASTIFLDVERVDSVSTPLATYVRAWIGALLERGRYRAGVYAHARNADSLHALQQAEYARHSTAGAPRFWVSGGAGTFELAAAPAESALPFATIWQGAADVRQSWAGVTLRIDVNVAERASPSAP